MRLEFVARDHGAIGSGIFFGRNFDGGKVRGQPGTRQLVGLLGVVALGHQDEMMTAGEIGQRFFDTGQQLDLLLGNRSVRSRERVRAFLRSQAKGSVARSNRPMSG